MKSKAIGFATSAADGLVDDDRLAIEPLSRRGIVVRPFVWDAGDTDIHSFDAVIIRSCWDYHLKSVAFQAWIESLRREAVPFWNPPKTVLRTINKRYLLDFEKLGAAIPRTQWLPQGARVSFDSAGNDAVVVKPAVSLNGYRTHLFRDGERKAALEEIASLARDGDVLIQEFIPEIETQGETSLVFFNGEFSHAIRKIPKAGEFRVHVEHGGKRIPYRPEPGIVAQAREILRMADEPLLYARVDGVEREGRLILMEFEAIDPMLYLACDSGAPERFAAAVAAAVKTRP